MAAPLVPVEILSIYPENSPNKKKLPPKMAQCAPDMKKAVLGARDELQAKGVILRLSDMFRSYDMQLQAHIENAKKNVFSPLPGGSLHEAGRAFDLDLDTLLKGNLIKLKGVLGHWQQAWASSDRRISGSRIERIMAFRMPWKSCPGSPVLPGRQRRIENEALRGHGSELHPRNRGESRPVYKSEGRRNPECAHPVGS